jgi:hypothetical protein
MIYFIKIIDDYEKILNYYNYISDEYINYIIQPFKNVISNQFVNIIKNINITELIYLLKYKGDYLRFNLPTNIIDRGQFIDKISDINIEDNDIVTNYETSIICHFSFPIGNFSNKNERMKKFMFEILKEIKWDEINDVLTEELQKNVKQYISKINNKPNYTSENNYGVEYRHLNNEVRIFTNFMIQKYEKGIGKKAEPLFFYKP